VARDRRLEINTSQELGVLDMAQDDLPYVKEEIGAYLHWERQATGDISLFRSLPQLGAALHCRFVVVPKHAFLVQCSRQEMSAVYKVLYVIASGFASGTAQ